VRKWKGTSSGGVFLYFGRSGRLFCCLLSLLFKKVFSCFRRQIVLFFSAQISKCKNFPFCVLFVHLRGVL